METICMKYQKLFSGKNKKKYFKLSPAENFTQSAKRQMHVCGWAVETSNLGHKVLNLTGGGIQLRTLFCT